jgi:hypothetical protein
VNNEGFCANWSISNDDCPYITSQDISITNSITEEEILASLYNPSTELTITNVNCPALSIGTFTTVPNHPLGIEEGLVLSTGKVSVLQDNNDVAYVATNNNGGGSDADIDSLSTFSNGAASYNVCVIEMNAYALTDYIAFEYVFGSEEYPENAETSFNDIFALMISGPGIIGDTTIAPLKNLAKTRTHAPITVNTVNAGENWQHYRSNLNDTEAICLDGLTTDTLSITSKKLTAYQKVTPCNTYHLKFAIADRGDTARDSAVFIDEVSTAMPVLQLTNTSGVDFLVENCNAPDNFITIKLPKPSIDTFHFDIALSGTAINGLDYTLNIPPTITFFPGMQYVAFPIEVISDNILEDDEAISLLLSANYGCGTVELSELTIPVLENLQIEIENGQDTIILCTGDSIELNAQGGDINNYFWAPEAYFATPNSQSPVFSASVSSYISVAGSLGTCTASDSIYMQYLTIDLQITTLDSQLCSYETTILTASNNVGSQGLFWYPNVNPDDPSNPVIEVGANDQYYKATISIGLCTVYDYLQIQGDYFVQPVINAYEIELCLFDSVQLADTLTSYSTYSWLPTTGLTNAFALTTFASPSESTAYTLTVTSQNNYCSYQYGPIQVNVTTGIDGAFLLNHLDSICLGDSISLAFDMPNGADTLYWSPQPSNDDALQPIFVPNQTTTYFAYIEQGPCVAYDSLLIVVDSCIVSSQDKVSNPLKLVPNPAKDLVALQLGNSFTTGGTLTLTTTTGQTLFNYLISPGQQSLILDVKSYPAGTYFCRFIQPNGTVWIEKLVVLGW